MPGMRRGRPNVLGSVRAAAEGQCSRYARRAREACTAKGHGIVGRDARGAVLEADGAAGSR
jgi:hypothetical protein